MCEKVRKRLIVIKLKSVVLANKMHELSIFIRLQKMTQFCEHFVPVVEVLLSLIYSSFLTLLQPSH